MGLTNYIKKKIQGTPAQQYQKQRRKAEDTAFKQKLYEAEQKGYQASALKQAEARGQAKAKGGNGFMAGVGGNLNALSIGINRAEKSFGFGSVVPTASNIDVFSNPMGFGMTQSERKQVPQKITKISPSGKVTIIEPATNRTPQKKVKQASPYNWMNEIDSNLLG